MSTLSAAAIASYAQKAGFGGQALVTAVAVALAESGGVTNAQGLNRSIQGRVVTSIDRGLWQINNVYHSEVSDACAYDPLCAAQAAYRISQGGSNWSPWSTFKSGAYRNFMSVALTATQAANALNTAPSPPPPNVAVAGTGSVVLPALSATDQMKVDVLATGPASDDPMVAYRLILAWALMLGALYLLAKTRLGYAAIYYGECLILLFLLATQSGFIREALSPLTKVTQPKAS